MLTHFNKKLMKINLNNSWKKVALDKRYIENTRLIDYPT